MATTKSRPDFLKTLNLFPISSDTQSIHYTAAFFNSTDVRGGYDG